MNKLLIIGATSAIAEATARHFARGGAAMFLVARNEHHLEAVAEDLRARGAAMADGYVMDINEVDRHVDMIRTAIATLDGLDGVLIAHGTLPDQKACEADPELTMIEFQTNAVSTIALLTPLATIFERQGFGTLAVITSVAADRGRQSNYVYGAAKAALETFLEGLRQRLHKSGVKVVTIKPGLIDTPMTEDFRKGFLWRTPDAVAPRIHRAITRGSDIVYVPGFWRLIMLIIRLVPRPIFKAITL